MLNYYIDLSDRILSKAKLEEDTTALRRELYYTRISSLESKVNTDELKKTFWINIYNAYLLIMIKEKVAKSNIFKLKRIKFSYYVLSLRDIENGILKIEKYRIGALKIRHPFYPDYIKKLALEKVDYNIVKYLNKNVLSNSADSQSFEYAN